MWRSRICTFYNGSTFRELALKGPFEKQLLRLNMHIMYSALLENVSVFLTGLSFSLCAKIVQHVFDGEKTTRKRVKTSQKKNIRNRHP